MHRTPPKGFALIALIGLITACTMPDAPEPPEGARMFADHCAACHGADAAGAGPETLGLGKVPPTARILSVIDGYASGSHPNRTMPEFGADLGGDLIPLDIDGTPTPTPRALVALLTYLESVQQ